MSVYGTATGLVLLVKFTEGLMPVHLMPDEHTDYGVGDTVSVHLEGSAWFLDKEID